MDLMNEISIRDMEANSCFNREEAWGNITQLSSYLILAGMIPYRELLDAPVIINNAYAISGHSTNSMHYRGLACDHHSDVTLYEQAKIAVKIGFNGIGAYPHWNNVGLHTDMRGLVNKPNVYWIRDEKNQIQHDNAVQKGEYWYFIDKVDWLYGVGLYKV